MSYIIKSNSALSNPANAVGNIHGYYGAPDYVGMLDFSNGIYKVNGVKKSIGDVISVNRNSTARYLDVFGEFKVASVNEPRVTYIPELGEAGLLMEGSHVNFVTSSDNGATFTAINASEDLYVSWEGEGTVDVAAALTLRREVKESNRTHRFYERSGAITSTIVVTGEVSNVMVSNSDRTFTYTEYLKPSEADVVTLANQLKSILSSGTGTILCRIVLPEGNGGQRGRTFHLTASNASSVRGSVTGSMGFKERGGLNTASVGVTSDDADINSVVQQARLLGNYSKVSIVGITFSNNGANTGVIAYGQANFGSIAETPATPPTALNEFYLGTPPKGLLSTSITNEFVITHCVVYDRILTPEEASDAAFFGR